MNILNLLFSRKKRTTSEYVSGMSKVKEYSDGSFELSLNRQPGSFNGAHYTEYVDKVKQLKREKRHEEAIALLLELVDATENESKTGGDGWGVAPWYYEQLAIIYRKEKRTKDEIEILERYMSQPKAPGAGPSKLSDRLKKAKSLLRH